MVARGWGEWGEEWIIRTQRISRAVKIFCTMHNDEYMSLCICSNPQNIQHQEWTLMLIMDFETLWCVNVVSSIIFRTTFFQSVISVFWAHTWSTLFLYNFYCNAIISYWKSWWCDRTSNMCVRRENYDIHMNLKSNSAIFYLHSLVHNLSKPKFPFHGPLMRIIRLALLL